MSHSPESAGAPADRINDYREGWRALSRMIAEGRSFSGHERNCCFLNVGHGEFADVSSLTELDFPDDSRAVAVVDWDFDGRLDFWITNRTAPRVRFLRNETKNDRHYVSLRLRGITCNRDAIGARVELFLDNTTDREFVRQLSAGDGYLAQSTKWLHFGIGDNARIDRIVVHWPGGDKETFRGFQLDQHYLLVEGSGRANRWSAPRVTIAKSTRMAARPNDESLMRTAIVGKVPVPSAEYHDGRGNRISLEEHYGSPLLVNLWSPSCVPCVTELSDWAKNANRLRSADLNVLALCVDSLLSTNATGSSRARQLLDDIEYPWLSGFARPELVQTLELMHHTYVEFKQDLPLPSSFLLDRHGRLAVIYKGRVPIATLLADVNSLDAAPVARRASAVPFPGRWASTPFPPDPEPIVKNLEKLGRTSDAVIYARRCIARLHDDANLARDENRKLLINLYAVVGEMLLELGNATGASAAFEKALDFGNHAAAMHRDIGQSYMTHDLPTLALPHLAEALRYFPGDSELLYHLGLAQSASRNPEKAIEYLTRAYKVNRRDANVCFHLANALHAIGQTRHAITLYEEALAIQPGWPFAGNNLAWILATHPDESLRNGAQAVRLGEEICRRTGRSDPSLLSTLAAAYAEVGRFEDAVETNRRAAELARQRGQNRLANRLNARRASYLERQPIRE